MSKQLNERRSSALLNSALAIELLSVALLFAFRFASPPQFPGFVVAVLLFSHRRLKGRLFT